jgi:hypothetical protein
VVHLHKNDGTILQVFNPDSEIRKTFNGGLPFSFDILLQLSNYVILKSALDGSHKLAYAIVGRTSTLTGRNKTYVIKPFVVALAISGTIVFAELDDGNIMMTTQLLSTYGIDYSLNIVASGPTVQISDWQGVYII